MCKLNIIEFLNIFLQFIDNINNITLHLIFDAINYDNDLIQLIQEKKFKYSNDNFSRIIMLIIIL